MIVIVSDIHCISGSYTTYINEYILIAYISTSIYNTFFFIDLIFTIHIWCIYTSFSFFSFFCKLKAKVYMFIYNGHNWYLFFFFIFYIWGTYLLHIYWLFGSYTVNIRYISNVVCNGYLPFMNQIISIYNK